MHAGIIDDLLEKERHGDLKRRAEDRQEWSSLAAGDLSRSGTLKKILAMNAIKVLYSTRLI